MKIRQEQSYEHSCYASDAQGQKKSINSVCLSDQDVSMQIYFLQLEEEVRHSPTKPQFNKSKSFIDIRDEPIHHRMKSRSAIYPQETYISIQNVPCGSIQQLLSYHQCPNIAKNTVRDRAFGAMFGFLIGDSLGSSLINRHCGQEEIFSALMMDGGGLLNLMPGQGSDQWQICLSLCQGLIDCCGMYEGNKIGKKYLEWIESNPFDLPVLMGIPFAQIKRRKWLGTMDMNNIGQQVRQGSIKNINHQSILGLIRIIPLAIWGMDLNQYEFNNLISQEMMMMTPNQFVVQTSIVFANLIKTIIKTGDNRLAFEQAQSNVYRFGSEKMVQLWSCIVQSYQPQMRLLNCNNLKFPFLYSINELLTIDHQVKDLRKSFIESAIRVLSKGFNTDTNCSIVLGLIGATIGYNNIPSYYRSKVANAQCSKGFRCRSRDYSSKRIVDVVDNLLRSKAKSFQSYLDHD